MKKSSPKKLNTAEYKLRQLFPNAITMTALGFGVSSLNMAFWGRWDMAVIFIALSAVFDFLDGGAARLLGVESKFGAQLDSLSDFVSFGVAPGFLMYQWTMDQSARIDVLLDSADKSEAIGIYWGIALFLAMCTAMRLARFNAMLEEAKPQPAYWNYFFMGVPAPAGAYLAILPLIWWLGFNKFSDSISVEFLRCPIVAAFFMLTSGILMASKVPTLCLKHLSIPEKMFFPLRMFLIFVLICVMVEPWISMGLIGIGYIISLPVSVYFFQKLRKKSI